jgi:zinc protease
LNAYTSFDETVYILPIPPTDSQVTERSGAGVGPYVTYLNGDIEGERAIILEEESRLGKGANDRMFKKIYPKLFEGSKYADRLPIGLTASSNFQVRSHQGFYKDWYRPTSGVIVVGDIDPAKAEEMVTKHFSSL